MMRTHSCSGSWLLQLLDTAFEYLSFGNGKPPAAQNALIQRPGLIGLSLFEIGLTEQEYRIKMEALLSRASRCNIAIDSALSPL